MPKCLPLGLENSLARLDVIINRQADALAQAEDAKVSVADLCRLFQLRLDLADRFETTKPAPILATWVDPAWALERSAIPAALQLLDKLRADYEAALADPNHDLR